jgi:hypothetical protein
LSYVWRGVNQLTLSKGNLTELEKGCALFGNELLRKTITDTIKICQDISQNYLWVDGLCILQEGEEVRYNHIGLMDAVCNLAFLTIVTASVDDATSGLPSFNALRLSPNCSLHVETISYNNFISSLSSKIAAEAIAELKRATHRWTLQEYVLSKRAVVFTGKYVFFRCEEALWAEDFGLNFPSFCNNGPGWGLPLYPLSTTVSDHYTGNYPQLIASVCSPNSHERGRHVERFPWSSKSSRGRHRYSFLGVTIKRVQTSATVGDSSVFPSQKRTLIPKLVLGGVGSYHYRSRQTSHSR